MVESRSMVNGASPGPAPACQARGQQLAAHPVQLADVAPAKAAQEDAQGGWRLDYAAESAGRPASAQGIGVVDAVAASQRGSDQRHYLVAGVGPARRIAQVQALLYQLGKAEVQGPRWLEGAGRRWPPGGGRRRRFGCGRGGCVVASCYPCILTLARDNSSYVAVQSAADR